MAAILVPISDQCIHGVSAAVIYVVARGRNGVPQIEEPAFSVHTLYQLKKRTEEFHNLGNAAAEVKNKSGSPSKAHYYPI